MSFAIGPTDEPAGSEPALAAGGNRKSGAGLADLR